MIVAFEGRCCADCLGIIANGTCGTPDETAAHAARMLAFWGAKFGQLVPACPPDCEGEFSWTACDGCNSRLGGDRHPFALLEEERTDSDGN
jgi:hypothetical protein